MNANTLSNILAVGCGGFVGAVLRYALSGWFQWRFPHFRPMGTLAVNLTGCFAIGLLMAVIVGRSGFPPRWQLFLITGILGSLTTFSTFSYETLELLREEDYRSAFWNVAANLGLGLPAVILGWRLMRLFFPAP